MFPDHYGSDYDYDAIMGHAHPEARLCEHGVDLTEADCGVCLDDALRASLCLHGQPMGVDCVECQVTAEAHLEGMFVKMLDRIRQTEDEAMGAYHAARRS